MKSMTGFGFAGGDGKDCRVEVSVKSVNSRFADVKFYTSPFYFSLERELKALVFSNCSRGQWVIRIDRCPLKPPSSFTLSRDEKQARRWLRLYRNLARELGVKNDMGVSHLARLEGVVSAVEKTPPLDPRERAKVVSLFKKALALCLREKAREGGVLKKDVMGNLLLLQKILGKIREIHQKETRKADARYKKSLQGDSAEREELLKFLANRLGEREGSLKGKKNFSGPPALWQKVFAGLAPADINEELVRMEAHLKNCGKLVSAQSGPTGKKLDFYTQEILRELNTIGSKSQTALITCQVVDGKTALEKIKEQVQNIE